MILELIEGLTQVLQDEWDIPIHTSNTEETGLQAPHFFISVLSSEETPLMGERCRMQIPVDIHYHPSDPCSLSECYSIAERLFEVTRTVLLPNGGSVRGQNKNFELTKGVIIFHVSFDFILATEREREEAMESVDGQVLIDSKDH